MVSYCRLLAILSLLMVITSLVIVLYFYDLTNLFRSRSRRDVSSTATKNYTPITSCDENQLMLNLANLQITSPERIILQITGTRKPYDVCDKVLKMINNTLRGQRECHPLEPDNLYVKLFRGLEMFVSAYCRDDQFQRSFNHHLDCYNELHEEYIDCEGLPDWFENSNKSKLCLVFRDIVECEYTKSAKLCGLSAAHLLYNLTLQVFPVTLRIQCELPNREPPVTDAMPNVDPMVVENSSQRPEMIMSIISVLFPVYFAYMCNILFEFDVFV